MVPVIFLKHTMLFAKTCTVSVNLDIYLIEKHKIIELQVQMRSQYHHENKKRIDFLVVGLKWYQMLILPIIIV